MLAAQVREGIVSEPSQCILMMAMLQALFSLLSLVHRVGSTRRRKAPSGFYYEHADPLRFRGVPNPVYNNYDTPLTPDGGEMLPGAIELDYEIRKFSDTLLT